MIKIIVVLVLVLLLSLSTLRILACFASSPVFSLLRILARRPGVTACFPEAVRAFANVFLGRLNAKKKRNPEFRPLGGKFSFYEHFLDRGHFAKQKTTG